MFSLVYCLPGDFVNLKNSAFIITINIITAMKIMAVITTLMMIKIVIERKRIFTKIQGMGQTGVVKYAY